MSAAEVTIHALDGSHPSMQEELDRKVIFELERLVLHHKQGKLSSSDFESGITTLFNTVSGLCSVGMMDLIAQTRKGIIGNPAVVRPVHQVLMFDDKQHMAGVTWRVGEGTVRVLHTSQPVVATVHQSNFTDETIPSEAAKWFFGSVVRGMVRRGYELRGF